jgi:alkylated DNA repair dioxygenase AlkB
MDYKALGLLIVENFLTPEEEQEILNNLDKSVEKLDEADRNQVWRYGKKQPYHNRNLSKEVPVYLQTIINKILLNKILENEPLSVSINEYFPGQGMEAHTDNYNAGPIITIVSLNSAAIIQFSRHGAVFNVDVPARSILQMQDDIRWKWKHKVLPVAETRYSIVFRC